MFRFLDFEFLDSNLRFFFVPGFGLADHRVPCPRGKIFGGSHAINNAGYTRGNFRDYDAWESVYGATGWNYRTLLPYFLRTENNTDPAVVAAAPRFHSTTGPLEISTPPNLDPIIGRWLNAVQQLGWPLSDYGNLEQQFGVTVLQCTQSATNWTRQTTASAYVEVNIARPNLHVLLHAHVTRVLFEGDSSSSNTTSNTTTPPTATGVEYVRPDDEGNRTYTVSARREVILSAGSINSPQILMLSGIGHQDHLSSLGIATRVELPVGDNLAEHFLVPFDFLVTNASDIGYGRHLYYNLNAANLYAFFTNASGPLQRLPFMETYIGTGVNGNTDWPDGVLYMLINQGRRIFEKLQNLFLFLFLLTIPPPFPVSPSVDAVIDSYDQSRREEWRQYLTQFVNDDRHIWVGISMFRPLSRGTVRLASSDPLRYPLIDPAYFSVTQDMVASVKTISTGFKIIESPYFAPYVQYSALPLPGCSFCTDGRPMSQCASYLTCALQTYTLTTYHPVGSNRMGNASSADAVVDERLRVRGVSRLRVIDSSVMPLMPNANPNAATMMLAERAVDILREDAAAVAVAG